MIRIVIQLLTLAALISGAVQASTPITCYRVTPENIGRYDDRFMVNVRKIDGFLWFEVTIQNPGSSQRGLLAVGTGRSIYIDNESAIRVQPSERGKSLVFTFGLSEAKVPNSVFEFGRTHTRYQLDLRAFVLDQIH